MSKSPKIGLTMRLEIETDRFYLGRQYSEAIEHFGGVPLHIALIPERRYIRECLENLDGILLPGSDNDIDPHYYGADPHMKLKKVVEEKDRTDLLVLEEAERLNLPVLSICFGMQALNVSRGGTLIQDIESQIDGAIKHEQGKPLARNSHRIAIDDDTLLMRLITTCGLDKDNIRVNSHHHQAIGALGSNLRVSARAGDSVIEFIEDARPERFVVGIQWHPELSWKTDKLSAALFERFVSECAPR